MIIGFILGTILGSFVKALSDRSLENMPFGGRSYCPKCQHKLAWYDLLPVFSYLLLQGRCRYCRKKISREYLVVEIVVGILVGFLFWQSILNFNFQFLIFNFELLFKTFFIAVLVALFLTDLKKMFIPDRIVKPAILIGLVSLFAITTYKIGYLYYSLSQNPIGQKLLPPHSDYFLRHALLSAQSFFTAIVTGLLIGGFFWGLVILTRGKGMGGGDIKLGAFIGIMLGFPGAVLALVLSFLSGALFGLILIATGKKHFGQSIPFGPFLVLGSLITLFWGSQILDWYLNLSP